MAGKKERKRGGKTFDKQERKSNKETKRKRRKRRIPLKILLWP